MPSPSSQSSLRDEDDAAADDDDDEARNEADKEADAGDHIASEKSFILLLLCPYLYIIPSIDMSHSQCGN